MWPKPYFLHMKGSRAKKAAEAAAAAEGGQEPTPPSQPREGAPRPGPIVGSSGRVQIPATEFKSLIAQLRSNELLGAAAADSFEAAAGLRAVASPQSKGAKDLRSEVAGSREDGGKKKGMNFDTAVPDEIPDLPPDFEEKVAKKRASVTDSDALDHEREQMENHCEKDAPEPPELNLNPKQNDMRTKLEMWVMDEIPGLFGVDDSEELDEKYQEDAQADQITFLIAERDEEAQEKLANKWLDESPADHPKPDADAKGEFVSEILKKVRKIQELGPKKKKKKKDK